MLKKIFFSSLFILHLTQTLKSQPIYICTAADEHYFPCLINLIGSLHKHNFNDITQIAVFDVGLTDNQKKELTVIEHLQVYQLEKANPDILTRFNTRSWGKPVPGWYSWKPVAFKQIFDIFPQDNMIAIWIDAGTTILQPLTILFDYIAENGYFFHNGSHWKMQQQTTEFVINSLDLKNQARSWILGQYGLESGFMGVTKQVYEDFILPAYELSKDIRYFADDGTCPGGFGNYRHDQTIFSICALLHDLHIYHHFAQPKNNLNLVIKGDKHHFHIACNPEDCTSETYVYCARFDVNPTLMASFIRCKNLAGA